MGIKIIPRSASLLLDTTVFYALFLFAFSIPIQARLFLGDFGMAVRGNEYMQAWLWGTDFLVVGIVVLSCMRGIRMRLDKNEHFTVFHALLFWFIFSVFSVAVAQNKFIGAWTILKYGECLVLFVALYSLSNKKTLGWIVYGLVAGGVFQSIVAFLQFRTQHDIGLRFLGESVLGPAVAGVAKMTIDGATLIRAYGTTPHANILAGYLLLGLIGAATLLLLEFMSPLRNRARQGIFAASFLLMACALILTGSRAVWFFGSVLVCGTVFFAVLRYGAGGQLWVRKETVVARWLGAIFTALLFSVIILFPVIGARGHLERGEQAIFLRALYMDAAEYLIVERPLSGVGAGAFVENIFPKEGPKKAPWMYQPVHNIYALVAAESGIPSLVGFILFMFFIAKRALDTFKQRQELFFIAVGIGVFVLFAIGVTDHFLMTLQQGRLLLWSFLGLVAGYSKESV